MSLTLLTENVRGETRSGFLRRKEVIADECDSDIKVKLHVTLNILLDPIFRHSVVWITSSDNLGHSLLTSHGQHQHDHR